MSIDYHRNIPLNGKYDVIVCGGGPSGIPAALAARRSGLTVLLVESAGQLGGTGTSAGVSHLLGGRTPDNKHECVGGIFAEVTRELALRGGAIDPLTIAEEKYSPHGWNNGALRVGVSFDPIAMSILLDEKMLNAGVDVLYFTQFVDAIVENGRVTHVVLFNKSGLFTIHASAVVDATGDGDVAARSGCEYVKGREEDGLMTPATLIFHVDHVDQEETSAYIYEKESPRFRELIQGLRETGEWEFPYDIFISVQLHEKGIFMINTTRICDVDGTDGLSISRGMMQGRKEVFHLFEVMRKHIPGFQNARIRSVAPALGIRETRRIKGEYVYTLQDVIDEITLPDVIGYSGYGWDLPDPKRPSHNPHPTDADKKTKTYTAIPYRCMVPQPIANVICPGRAISVERIVLGPLREQAPCYAMGHAAGLAAAQVIRRGIAFSEVNTDQLREELRSQGAVVDLAD